MKRIIFLDYTSDINHNIVQEKAIGASEFIFYITLFKLAQLIKNREFICYNKTITNKTIDNILYKNINIFENDYTRENDIIIIQRLFPKLLTLKNILSNNIYLWQHDYDFNAIFKGTQNNNILESINFICNNKKIKFLFNSNFSKRYIISNLENYNIELDESRINILPNYLFEDYFHKQKNITKNKYQLVYASGWNKGINSIIDIFEYIISNDNNFKLFLMSPGYEYDKYKEYINFLKDKFKDNITILGPVNKLEYSKIIQESACVLAPPFPETFGCVFSESYYLGTPVIADVTSGAVSEIIGFNNIVDYRDLSKTYNKLLEIINKNNAITLNDKYIFNMNIWKIILKV
jgi:hypothetical protein